MTKVMSVMDFRKTFGTVWDQTRDSGMQSASYNGYAIRSPLQKFLISFHINEKQRKLWNIKFDIWSKDKKMKSKLTHRENKNHNIQRSKI